MAIYIIKNLLLVAASTEEGKKLRICWTENTTTICTFFFMVKLSLVPVPE